MPRKSRVARGVGAGGSAAGQPRLASVRALDRGLALLGIIAAADGLPLMSIAQRAGIAASTTHRILATLKANDFVQFDEAHGGWFIGVRAFQIGNAFLRNRKLADVGRNVMRDLVARCGETVNLGIEDKGDVVFIAQLESHHAIRAFHRPGSRGVLHASSLGKAILAALPESEVARHLPRVGLQKFTDHTIADPEILLRDLAAIRERGWAIDDEERAIGMRCVGAAIYNEHGEVAGAISVSGPVARMNDERMRELGPMIRQAANEITERVGGRLPWSAAAA